MSGAAGLVGQNLIPSLKATPDLRIVAADKHPVNTQILAEMHPDIKVLHVDLAEPGVWEEEARDCDFAIQLHAQIGGLEEAAFERNNITATERVLSALKSGGRCNYLIHVSSSVVNSKAVDFYTESKKRQERLVEEAGIPHISLRPTLMFGWFDRKHLGWLKRFMERVPVFPIPGDGKYLRQPLYCGDFSSIILSCVHEPKEGVFDISGQRKVDYIDLIREMRTAIGSKTPIVNIPYWLFWSLLKTYAVVDRDPPFTTNQLAALVTPDVFDVIDWPTIFGVQATDLSDALHQTFNHPEYSKVFLEF